MRTNSKSFEKPSKERSMLLLWLFFLFSCAFDIYSSTINSLHEPYAELTIHFSMRTKCTQIDVEESNQKRLNGGRTSREYISIRKENANLIRAERCLCIRRTCSKRRIKKIRRNPNRHILGHFVGYYHPNSSFFHNEQCTNTDLKIRKNTHRINIINEAAKIRILNHCLYMLRKLLCPVVSKGYNQLINRHFILI